MKDSIRFTAVMLVAVIATAAISVAAWHLGWFVREKDVDREARLTNRNVGTQIAWRDEVEDGIATAALLEPGSPQRTAVVRQTCSLAGRLTKPFVTPSIEQFVYINC